MDLCLRKKENIKLPMTGKKGLKTNVRFAECKLKPQNNQSQASKNYNEINEVGHCKKRLWPNV